MSYGQITKEERIKLESYLEAGFTQERAALKLGRSKGTISREIARNSRPDGVYDARYAYKVAQRRRRKPPYRLSTDHVLQQYVIDRLFLHWSPEQIAGRLKQENGGVSVIHFDTIYWWIYLRRRELKPFLRQARTRRWRRKRGTRLREKQRELKKKRSIEERPDVIERRERVGDWEGDTFLGLEKTVRVATHVERKTGYALARLTSANATDFRIQAKIAFSKVPKNKRLTCTYDNGIEMAQHEIIEKETGMTIYFAHPYSSQERGTNENTNGLYREFFPKRTPLASITQKELDRVSNLLNNRPRKRLGYATPREVFRSCS